MAIPKDIRKYIEGAKWDDLEEAWLEHLATGDRSPDFFVETARFLKGAGEEDRAAWLLEIVDEEWAAEGAWQARLDLRRRIGALMGDSESQHGAIVESLRALYPEAESFDGFADFVGLNRAIEDTQKVWRKADTLRALLQYEVGAPVWMKDKGAGRVVEVNFDLGSFKVDFEQLSGLRVGFKGAAKLLTPLPEGHVLRRKLDEPEELTRLKEESPSDLLIAVLESWDEPLAAAEVREALFGIVEPSEWTSWWNAARKSDRVLAEGTGARQRYRAVASSEKAGESIASAFAAAGLAQRLELFRRYADRDEKLRAAMADRLRAAAAATSSPQEAASVWFALSDAGEAPDPDATWSPQNGLREVDDPVALLRETEDRGLRERLYRLVTEVRPDAPEVLTACLAQEPEAKLLDQLCRAVSSESVESFVDAILAQPRRLPAALTWLAEGAGGRGELVTRSPLRLLQHVLSALGQDELKPFKPRLNKVIEGSNLLPRLVQAVTADQAPATEQALVRGDVEEYIRTPLVNALHLRFSELRTETSDALYALSESIEGRRAEMRRLKEEEIPANRRAIEEARELGDLRENFEYKSARERHEYLNARLAELDRDLARARPIDLQRDDADEVRIASTVRVAEDGQESSVTILGPWESDPENGVVSYDSDLGRALLGHAAGESVEFGERSLSVLAIEAYRG